MRFQREFLSLIIDFSVEKFMKRGLAALKKSMELTVIIF